MNILIHKTFWNKRNIFYRASFREVHFEDGNEVLKRTFPWFLKIPGGLTEKLSNVNSILFIPGLSTGTLYNVPLSVGLFVISM